jgi:hypothetical protein
MAKTKFKFPILVIYVSLEQRISLNARASWPSLCRRPGRLQPYPFIRWDDVWMCGPVNSVWYNLLARSKKLQGYMGYHSLHRPCIRLPCSIK